MAHTHSDPTDSGEPPRKAALSGGWTQAVVLLVMLLIWPAIGAWSALAFLGAYVCALIIVNYAPAWFGLAGMTARLSVGQRCALGLLLATPAVAVLVRVARDAEPMKALAGAQEFARDKMELQKLPAIFPALLRADQPQRFFIHSPGSREVTVRLSAGSAPLATENVGHGLFMLDFDPRKTALNGEDGETRQVVLAADGVAHERAMRLVVPRPHPRWFASSPSAGIAATVSEETDELILVHRDGKSRRVEVDDGPADCAFFAGGSRVAVCHKFAPALCIVDAAEGKILERHELPRFQTRLAASPDEKVLAVALDGAQRGIQFLSLPDAQKLSFVPLPFSPDWIAFGRDAGELVVTDRVGRKVVRLRNKPQQPQWTMDDEVIELARPVVTMCRGAGGKQMILSATTTELDHEPITANHFIEDTIHHLDLEDWEVVESYPTHRGGLDQDDPGTTEHGVSPMSIAVYGDGLLIAFAGTNEVALNTPGAGSTLDFTYIDDEPLSAPHGVADLGDDTWCVSSPVDGTIGIYDDDVELLHLIRLAPDEEEMEEENSGPLKRLRGERTFYEATRSGVSCQSCHLHTDTDHSQHSIGAAELVDVLTVHGVAGTSPYLREGPYAQLRGLHKVVLEVYRDYENEVEWDRAEALEHYMSSLPPRANWRMLEPHDPARLRQGMDAFVKAQCAHCHVPPAMTNLGQHPAKVVFPEYGAAIEKEFELRSFLDVPGLRGISLSPPFLHDGRAPSLESVFQDHNPSNRHGDTARLSKDEFRALIDFLEQL